jgi:DNA repair photolyase
MPFRRVENPPNPWKSVHLEWLDAPPPAAALEIYEEHAQTILSENDSPDIGFRYSLNPYRGCFHACAYCYARPSHQYWDFGAGTDFERKLIVKVNAAEKLRETFLKKAWCGERIAFSGNTDCYQPLEASYELTRRCLEVCRDFRNPVGIITKSALVRRDAALIGEIHRLAQAYTTVSIPFADAAMARKIEPNAPSPQARLEAVRALAAAGVPVGVALAPIIPGLNDSQIPEILERARDHGATSAFHILLRLPLEVKDVFFARLAEAYPDRVAKVEHAIKEMRGGKLYDSRFGMRGKGTGERWEAIAWLFELTCKRLGLNVDREMARPTPPQTFRRPLQPGTQMTLWES